MAKASIELIEAMAEIAEAAEPITGRGVGYKLFTAGLIPSMSTPDMQKVYRLLQLAREDGTIPWEWIVDETRDLERKASWGDPEDFLKSVGRQYRRDHWDQQPVRVEVWSEKGTDDIADYDDGRDLIALYCGDYDPSGLYMSEHDLPDRLDKYEGYHVNLKRIALIARQTPRLPSFPPKPKDTRYRWFVQNYGRQCWELDAMDPNDLRACVETAIRAEIDFDEWDRCAACEKAEQESPSDLLRGVEMSALWRAEVRTCPCGETFRPKREGQRFCSATCGSADRMSRKRSRNTTAEPIPTPRSRNRGLTPPLTGSEGHPENKWGTEPTMVWPERDLAVEIPPGALHGDDVELEYYEDGYPKLPACLDRRRS